MFLKVQFSFKSWQKYKLHEDLIVYMIETSILRVLQKQYKSPSVATNPHLKQIFSYSFKTISALQGD